MKMYIVAYSSGSYEDWREHLIFVTQDKEKAEKYIEKANNLLVKCKEFYDKKSSEELDANLVEFFFTSRSMDFNHVNRFYIKEIEVR
jgi:hypothetical protein